MQSKMRINKEIVLLIVFALIIFPLLLIQLQTAYKNYNNTYQSAAALNSFIIQQKYTTGKEEKPLDVKNLNIKAKAFVIFDTKNKTVLAEKHAQSLLPLASLTKLFTTALALEYLSVDSKIIITSKALETEGYSQLKEASAWRLKTLISYMLTVSSNDAAEAIRIALEKHTKSTYLDLIKEFTKKTGLKGSFAVNPSGLDESSELSGAYGSAEEIAKLMSFLLKTHPNVLMPTTKRELVFHDLSGNTYEAKNTNKFITHIFNPLASKTGFTDLAGGNLVIAFEPEPEHVIVIVVLGSSKEARFSDIEKLYKATIEYLAVNK